MDPSITTETHEKLRRHLKNREWLGQNLKEVQAKYAEQWVALSDQKIVSHGMTVDEVKKDVSGKYPSHEVIILRVPKGEISRPM